jgi:hypothetical protein
MKKLTSEQVEKLLNFSIELAKDVTCFTQAINRDVQIVDNMCILCEERIRYFNNFIHSLHSGEQGKK